MVDSVFVGETLASSPRHLYRLNEITLVADQDNQAAPRDVLSHTFNPFFGDEQGVLTGDVVYDHSCTCSIVIVASDTPQLFVACRVPQLQLHLTVPCRNVSILDCDLDLGEGRADCAHELVFSHGASLSHLEDGRLPHEGIAAEDNFEGLHDII